MMPESLTVIPLIMAGLFCAGSVIGGLIFINVFLYAKWSVGHD